MITLGAEVCAPAIRLGRFTQMVSKRRANNILLPAMIAMFLSEYWSDFEVAHGTSPGTTASFSSANRCPTWSSAGPVQFALAVAC